MLSAISEHAAQFSAVKDSETQRMNLRSPKLYFADPQSWTRNFLEVSIFRTESKPLKANCKGSMLN